MTKKLATFVHVDGQAYGPDSDVPKDVADKITNPKAWGDEPADEADEKPAPKGRAVKK